MANEIDLKKGILPSVVYGILAISLQTAPLVTEWGFFYNYDNAKDELTRLREKHPQFEFVLKQFSVYDFYK